MKFRKEIERLVTSIGIKNWIKSMVKKDGGSEDHVLELITYAAMKVQDHLDDGKEIENLEAYFKAIARNRWNRIDQQRKRRPRTLSEDHLPILSENPWTKIEQTELLKQVSQLIKSMGGTCAQILDLFYFEGFRLGEIASHPSFEDKKVKDKVSWVKSRKHECLKKLITLVRQRPDLNL